MNNNTRLQFLEKVLTLTPTIDNPFDLLLFQELHVSMNQTTNREMNEIYFAITRITHEQ